MSVYPICRHKKGNLYTLHRVWLATRDYKAGEEFYPHCSFLYAHTVTDDISAGEYVACYKTELNSCTPENPMKYWARPLEMFFDGRFERVRQ